MCRSINRISHDVANLKVKIFVPKVEESIESLYVYMDESKKRAAMLRARRELLEKVFSSDFFRKSDEALTMIDFLFNKFKIDENGLEKSQL